MESDEVDNLGGGNASFDEHQALNSTILEYYKKFGRKRDLEQYFSLSTAQGEIRDPSGLFWRRMKAQHDSSDSGEKSRESSLEVCRISIKCAVPDTEPSSSQDENPKTKSDTESPPIIVEEPPSSRHSDNESIKSDDNNSQKSMDAIDTSINKALSPSSSITSQRRLEWDSLADVGYANESDKRNSASSLSTLERLALKQQYSNSDTKDNVMGVPTAHSTPIDEDDPKAKSRKGSKTTKIYRKDVDFLEVNVPQGSANPTQSINVNLTKHISFNLEKNGAVSVDNIKKDVSVYPEKVTVETDMTLQEKIDKEIQTSLIKTKEKSCSSNEITQSMPTYTQGIPVLINLNTLKKRHKRRKVKTARKKVRVKPKTDNKENLPVLEKSGDQVSEAESFEYMPGHIYNQNQMNKEIDKPSTSHNSDNTPGNKSSLESTGPTTDSSKGSKHSFTKDLEKSIKLLTDKLNKRYNDTELKERLVKEVVQRLLKSSYRDDDPSTDFLSGLSFSSKKLEGEGNNTTTSTSDANNTSEKMPRPRKSILRMDKFNANAIASTSQSAPNLPTVSNSENPVSSKLTKVLTSSNTESDVSSKEKTSSDTAFAKTSSEELYQKYLEALRREENYKRHLRDKEMFLKQKLVASDTSFNLLSRVDAKSQIRLKDLMKDLTRNNYDDGSGDASKLEGNPMSNFDIRYRPGGNQRSHSVFTLSSSPNSEQNRRSNLKKSEVNDSKAGHSRDGNHYCCCSRNYSNKLGVSDSAVQVNFKNDDERASQNDVGTCCRPRYAKNVVRPSTARAATDYKGDMRPLCLCNKKVEMQEANTDEEHKSVRSKNQVNEACGCSKKREMIKNLDLNLRDDDDGLDMHKISRCSQTNLKLDYSSHTHESKEKVCLHEAIRCIQTDISINPKISEPTVTDIKFVKNCDCVKLIREQFRQVSKSSIDSETNTQSKQTEVGDDDAVISRAGSETKSKRKTTQRVNAEVQSAAERSKSNNEKIEGNFTIPIQGTNMTLKVSVGSANPLVAKTDNAASTERVETFEGATSVSEECSKGMQSRDGIFSKGVRPSNTVFNRVEHPGSSRPFVRANTHTGIMERGCDVQNDLLDQFFAKNQESSSDERQYHRSGQYIDFNTYPQYVESRGDRARKDQIQYYTDGRLTTDQRMLNPDARMNPNQTFVPIHNSRRPIKSTPGVFMRSESPESADPRIDTRSSPCPCPVPSTCGNICAEEASCRQSDLYDDVNTEKNEFVKKTAYVTSKPTSQSSDYSPRPTSPQGNMYDQNNRSFKQDGNYSGHADMRSSPCPCPVTSACENVCAEDASCRQSDPYNKLNPQRNEFGKNTGYPTSKPPDQGFVYGPGPTTQPGNVPQNSMYLKQPIYGAGPEYRPGSPSARYLSGPGGNYGGNADCQSSGHPIIHHGPGGAYGGNAAAQSLGHPILQHGPGGNYGGTATAQSLGHLITQHGPGGNTAGPSFGHPIVHHGPGGNYGGNAAAQSLGHPGDPVIPQYVTQYSHGRQPDPSNQYTTQPSLTTGRYADVYSLERNDNKPSGYPNKSANYGLDPINRNRDPDSGHENIEQRQIETESTKEKVVERYGNVGQGQIREQPSADKGLQTESNLTEQSEEKYEVRRVRQSSPSPGATDLEDEIQEEILEKESEYEQEETIYRTRTDPSNLPYDDPAYRKEYKYEKKMKKINYDEPVKKSGFKSGSWENETDNRLVNYREASSSKQSKSLPGSPRKKPILAQSKPYKRESPRSPRQPTQQKSKYHLHCAPEDKNYLESPRSVSPSRASSRSRSPDSYRGQSPRGHSRSPSPARNNQGQQSPRSTSPRKPKIPCPTAVNNYMRKASQCICPASVNCKGFCQGECTENDPRSSKVDASSIKKSKETLENATSKALITNVIQDIINRYTKKDIQQTQRKKCFKEIISILNYLLETEESDDVKKHLNLKISDSSESSEKEVISHNKMTSEVSDTEKENIETKTYTVTKKLRSVGSGTNEFERVSKLEVSHSTANKKLVDKGVQGSVEKRSKASRHATESSDLPVSTDLPGTSTDSATCRVLNKIRRECEKYHQKRCKSHGGTKKCECSSTTDSCEQCNRAYLCTCRPHKCKGHRSRSFCDKLKKKCVAYNLIIQTSDSMISEEAAHDNNCRPLKNIIVKVPPKRKQAIETVPHKEVIGPRVPFSSPRYEGKRSRSLPNENYLSSTDEARTKQNIFTVRDYLERNRPDFIEQYTKRQNCLKMISETRANERSAQRQLLSLQVQMDDPPLTNLSASDLRRLAKELGLNLRSKKVPSKLMSEREMKKHSEKIYKTLPEVTRKKEELKKENIKKTNLLMASLFKKNLQKKTLRGTVNLSNYNKVIKI